VFSIKETCLNVIKSGSNLRFLNISALKKYINTLLPLPWYVCANDAALFEAIRFNNFDNYESFKSLVFRQLFLLSLNLSCSCRKAPSPVSPDLVRSGGGGGGSDGEAHQGEKSRESSGWNQAEIEENSR
jgi:hypothetical protein